MLTVLVVGILLLSLCSAALFLWRCKRALDKIAQTAKLISGGALGERVSIRTEKEAGEIARSFNAMAESLETTIRRLENEKREADAVLGAMAEQVFAVDYSGKILFLNPAAEKIFGVSNSTAVGRNFLEIVRHAKISQLIQATLTEGLERKESISLNLGSERFFDARASILREQENRRGVLVVLHDVTEIRKLEQVRRDFVANVSHELRTPLTSIQGFAETLLSGALSDSKHQREFVETIHKQSVQLSGLVNDLLDLSALESGQKTEFVSVPLSDLLKEVCSLLSPLAKSRGIEMSAIGFDDSLSLHGNRDQLKQVFLNLLENAIKFNRPNGSVHIRLVPDASTITIAIQDSGTGIPQKDIPRIFERFYRVDKARSRELGGTGLGLAIVKHIVEKHYGSIRVESKENQGATFFLTFPH